MKTVFIFIILSLAACTTRPEKPFRVNITPSPADLPTFLSISKDKNMFLKVKADLDLSAIVKVSCLDNVEIFMAKFKDQPDKIYAINSLGNEILYAGKMIDEKNGSFGLLKNEEAIVVEFKDGIKEVRDIPQAEFAERFASKFHGGPGFCQRQPGESFGNCFKAESDEFCDSFISCVALVTQPSVAIIIGLACSCNP